MTKMKITDVASQVHDLLAPFDSEERTRIVSAAMTLLGENALALAGKGKGRNVGAGDEREFSENGLHPKAQAWATQNGLVAEQLGHVFHITDQATAADVIGTVPGKGPKEKTPSAYVIAGAANFVSTGSLAFTDKEARKLCEAQGCYDHTNHTKRLAGRSNYFAGSKDKGWTLTQPGLKRAADLIKEMTKVS